MDPIEILKSLVGAGSAGAVIYVVIIFLKHEKDLVTNFQSQLENIQTRNIEEQRLARTQINLLFEQTRALFDRVIAICVDLTNAITGLKDQTRANELAIRSNEALTRSLFEKTDSAIQNLEATVKRFEAFQGGGEGELDGPHSQQSISPPHRQSRVKTDDPRGSRP